MPSLADSALRLRGNVTRGAIGTKDTKDNRKENNHMGSHSNITHEKFPKQGDLLNKPVVVCFHYDTTHTINGICVRDDREEPWMTIFKLDDGRYIRAEECQYRW